jgi:acetyl-CoA carboxylase/biotin carboxylase 1
MRQWAAVQLGDTQALTFVVMATPEDIAANAAFVLHADVVVEVKNRPRSPQRPWFTTPPASQESFHRIAQQVPGGHNFNNYANVNLIVTTAVSQHVDAVWPGASRRP